MHKIRVEQKTTPHQNLQFIKFTKTSSKRTYTLSPGDSMTNSMNERKIVRIPRYMKLFAAYVLEMASDKG